MPDTFSNRKVKPVNLVVVSEECTFDGTSASWVVPNGMKVLFAGAETVSGTGNGYLTWSGSTVTAAGFTDLDVIRLWATCYPGPVGQTGDGFGRT